MSASTAGAAESGRDLRAAWRRLRWQHPEWTLAIAAVVAWVALLATAGGPGGSMAVPKSPTHHGISVVSSEPQHVMSAAHWCLMVVAMMLPTALPAARLVALRGKWKRRQRGPALFVSGYIAVWMAAGLLALAVLRYVAPGAHGRWAVVAALVTASVWELTVWKPRFLRACHRHPPVPPDGWKADVACLQRGARNAVSCGGACWAIMTPMLVADHVHALWLMVPLGALITYQKAGTPSRVVRPAAAGLAAGAIAVAIW
ncbi:hypothetical protein CQY20_09295 [Mycolicibacterium agri]|uniref:DUF2182 domain-containing protein n=1 Tax=Mycolicibacterium agri TaxID=36811 RepID=A0A2A7N8H2_MYCAG|nr:DUF2182 domain-containing protein [Mycolicibacterium agri]PEG39738.1 hypothetical protein CQY20_09295 [Mycolicibacterium agri]GFG52553.1 hypothetical protein MAGR_39940 [Mycolicibacterium agri]